MTENNLMQTASEIFAFSGLLLKFFNQGLERRLVKYGTHLSSLQYNIVRMLAYEQLTISTISKRLGMDPAALVRLVDSLERKGLVLRGKDPHDRRRNPLQITQKGLELVQAIPVIAVDDDTYRALQSIGTDTARQLRDLLTQFVQQFPEGRVVSEIMLAQSGNS